MCDCGAPCSSRIGGPDPPMTPLISAPLVFTLNDLKPGKYFSVLGTVASSAMAAPSREGVSVEVTPSAAICLRRSRRFMCRIVMQNSEGRMQKDVQKPSKSERVCILNSAFCIYAVSEEQPYG